MVEEGSDDLPAELDAAHERYASATETVEAIGREHLQTLGDALTRLDRLIDEYEDRATGTGDFGGYVAFRQQVEGLVEDLPSGIPHREAFETVADTVDQRRLSKQDFEDIRRAVVDVREALERLDDEEAARVALEDTRRRAASRITEIDDRLDHIDRMLALADVDLDAPVEEIHIPIEQYNEAVEDAFDVYLHKAPATEVLALFALTDRYPLVSMPATPTRLVEYLGDVPESLTVPELLEYADYSNSKLAHYVDDPAALKTAVSTDRMYLERLSGEPFTIDWPPPTAANLGWRIRELVSVVDRFAPEEVLVDLRSVRGVVDHVERFDHLREVAIARSTLDANQRERIRSGEMMTERDALVAERDRLAATLDGLPSP